MSRDEALADIASRLRALVGEHGPESVAAFIGNPPFFGFEAPMALDGFLKAIGTDRRYSIFADDLSARIVSQGILYGSPAQWVVPDFWSSDFAMIIGSNPVVSKGGMVNEPLIRDALHGIVERGGRVLVVDPRRTETAKQFEHVPVTPGGDPWLVAGLIRVVLDKGLHDREWLDRHTTGLPELTAALAGFELERCAERSGVPADQIRDLAVAFAEAGSAVVYGRTGTCTQRFGTLTNLLQDILMALTGNIGRPGGAVFGWGPIDYVSFMKLTGMASYGKYRSRVRGLPDALEQLDLHFSLDFSVHETNRHADYVLPVPTFYERPDVPFSFLNHMLRPTLFATDAVIERRGEARSEWEVLDELAGRLGFGGTHAVAPLRWLAKLGVRVPPIAVMELILRTSRVGDWFGLRRGGG